MTTTFGADENNDLYLGDDGNIVVLTGLPAVATACEQAAKAQLGEMVLETQLGLPNFESVWVGSPNIPLWTSVLRATLESVPGVIAVVDLEVQQVGEALQYTATISSQFGEAEING